MGAVGGSTLRSGQPVTVVLTNQWIWTVCVASTCSSDTHWYYIHFPLPTRGPAGKNSGVVKGVKYFKCKDKHGMFVRRDKITVQSSSPALGKPSS